MFAMKISKGGRVVIPATLRRLLAVSEGDTVIWVVHDNEVRLTTRKRQLDQARALVQQYIPAGSAPDLVDELIQDRRKENLNESK
jgi:AbrB family looped-hinge helix DNA binding protein